MLAMNLGLHQAKLYFQRAYCYFLLQELEPMYQDLLECIQIDPHHQYAQALLSVYEESKSSFQPFPSRDPVKLHEVVWANVQNSNVLKPFVLGTLNQTTETVMLNHSGSITTNLITTLPPKQGGPVRKIPEPIYDAKHPTVRVVLPALPEKQPSSLSTSTAKL
jgi:hypothetical protein